jgi:hypothetical protein
MTSQTFYGLSMHWAQYCGMYEMAMITDVPFEHDFIEVKTLAWKSWVAREIQLRTLLGLCIIDGVVSQFSGNSVTSWLTANSLPLPADEETFNADTPNKWIVSIALHGKNALRFCDLSHSLFPHDGSSPRMQTKLALFDVKILLEILSSLAAEFKRTDPPPIGIPAQSKIVQALREIRYQILNSDRFTSTDRSIGLLRWHAVCLDMVASIARGARRMCYQYGINQHIFGGEKRMEYGIDPHHWVHGLAARKSLLHALQIQSIATQMPLGAAHDLHLAGALFAAATTFSSFALTGTSKVVIPLSIDWDTVLTWEPEELPEKSTATRTQNTYGTVLFLQGNCNLLKGDCEVSEIRNLSYDLSSLRLLLRALSLQWGVAQEMEGVVEAWILRCV